MTLIIRSDLTITRDTKFTDDVQLAAGATLTVSPGVTLDLGGREILVFGTVNVVGSVDHFATLANGTISTESTSGRINIDRGRLDHVTVDDFFSDGAITITNSIVDESAIGSMPTTTISSTAYSRWPTTSNRTSSNISVIFSL